MNDLDDDLLKELGLEPSISKVATPPKEPPAAKSSEQEAPLKQPLPAKQAPVAKKVEGAQTVKNSTPQTVSGAPKPVQAQPMTQGISQVMDVQLIAVVGKKTTTLSELIALREGSILDLNKLPNELIDLVANGKLVAKGQLVLIEGRVGVQIKQVYK